jgi:tRNA pseudouridine38-40 synthase
MARYQIILAYDGTEFQGFQRQADARTVQGVVEFVLRKLNWQGKTLLAAGRTDTGVHATGQVIAFDLQWVHTPGDLLRAMNANLPMDVAVQQVMPALPDFHPRYDAISRCYRYHILCEPVRNPLIERYAWRVWPPVNLDRLNHAASSLLGSHDFSAFGNPPRPGGRTVRAVTKAEWFREGPFMVFEIASRAFLYHMVRRLVSFQVEIGQGRHEDGAMTASLNEPPAGMVTGLAPAQGLVLKEICYPPEKLVEA